MSSLAHASNAPEGVPQVSVVVPAHNAAPWIETQLEALSRQQGAPTFEVIVVDNRSEDETATIAANWMKGFPPGSELRLVKAHARLGVSYARNVGLQAARGSHLLICDADDRVFPTWVRSMSHALRTSALVGGAVGRSKQGLPRDWDRGTELDVSGGLFTRLEFLPFASGCNTGVLTDIARRLGGWDERYVRGGDDVEFSWRAQLSGHALAFVPEAVIYYRDRADLSATFWRRFYWGRTDPLLYRDFRRYGARRRSTKDAARVWAWVLIGTLVVPFKPGIRDEWVKAAATALGRVAGSVRFRVFCL